MTQVFVDMDGVLADFDTHYRNLFGVQPDKKVDNVDWKKVANTAGFYGNIPPMPDMWSLWEYVEDLTPKPIILTGIPSSVEEAASNKRTWVTKHLGNVQVICCPSKDKSLYAQPGDILIDDWERYKDRWIDKGGRWITHTSAKSTIAQLQVMSLFG